MIADLGVHHVEGFILEAGHTAQRLYPDYGYDLALFTHDETGYVEPGVLFVQVKASESLGCSPVDVLTFPFVRAGDHPRHGLVGVPV